MLAHEEHVLVSDVGPPKFPHSQESHVHFPHVNLSKPPTAYERRENSWASGEECSNLGQFNHLQSPTVCFFVFLSKYSLNLLVTLNELLGSSIRIE